MPLLGRSENPFAPAAVPVKDLFEDADGCARQRIALMSKHWNITRGITLFSEGDKPVRIFIHRSGRVRLRWSNGYSRSITARIAGPHYIFGLIETLSNSRHLMTMQAMGNSTLEVIESAALLDLVREDQVLCFRLAEVLSQLCISATRAIRSH
jgi:CRP-like cAMP-binding protein